LIVSVRGRAGNKFRKNREQEQKTWKELLDEEEEIAANTLESKEDIKAFRMSLVKRPNDNTPAARRSVKREDAPSPQGLIPSNVPKIDAATSVFNAPQMVQALNPGYNTQDPSSSSRAPPPRPGQDMSQSVELRGGYSMSMSDMGASMSLPERQSQVRFEGGKVPGVESMPTGVISLQIPTLQADGTAVYDNNQVGEQGYSNLTETQKQHPLAQQFAALGKIGSTDTLDSDASRRIMHFGDVPFSSGSGDDPSAVPVISLTIPDSKVPQPPPQTVDGWAAHESKKVEGFGSFGGHLKYNRFDDQGPQRTPRGSRTLASEMSKLEQGTSEKKGALALSDFQMHQSQELAKQRPSGSPVTVPRISIQAVEDANAKADEGPGFIPGVAGLSQLQLPGSARGDGDAGSRRSSRANSRAGSRAGSQMGTPRGSQRGSHRPSRLGSPVDGTPRKSGRPSRTGDGLGTVLTPRKSAHVQQFKEIKVKVVEGAAEIGFGSNPRQQQVGARPLQDDSGLYKNKDALANLIKINANEHRVDGAAGITGTNVMLDQLRGYDVTSTGYQQAAMSSKAQLYGQLDEMGTSSIATGFVGSKLTTGKAGPSGQDRVDQIMAEKSSANALAVPGQNPALRNSQNLNPIDQALYTPRGGNRISGVSPRLSGVQQSPRLSGAPALSPRLSGQPALSPRLSGQPALSPRLSGQPALSPRLSGAPQQLALTPRGSRRVSAVPGMQGVDVTLGTNSQNMLAAQQDIFQVGPTGNILTPRRSGVAHGPGNSSESIVVGADLPTMSVQMKHHEIGSVTKAGYQPKMIKIDSHDHTQGQTVINPLLVRYDTNQSQQAHQLLQVHSVTGRADNSLGSMLLPRADSSQNAPLLISYDTIGKSSSDEQQAAINEQLRRSAEALVNQKQEGIRRSQIAKAEADLREYLNDSKRTGYVPISSLSVNTANKLGVMSQETLPLTPRQKAIADQRNSRLLEDAGLLDGTSNIGKRVARLSGVAPPKSPRGDEDDPLKKAVVSEIENFAAQMRPTDKDGAAPKNRGELHYAAIGTTTDYSVNADRSKIDAGSLGISADNRTGKVDIAAGVNNVSDEALKQQREWLLSDQDFKRFQKEAIAEQKRGEVMNEYKEMEVNKTAEKLKAQNEMQEMLYKSGVAEMLHHQQDLELGTLTRDAKNAKMQQVRRRF